MKTNILSFLLGIFIIISIAATVPSVNMFQPVKPKVVIVQSYEYDRITDIKNFIISYSNKGYIVKSVSISPINGNSSHASGIVVMEKY